LSLALRPGDLVDLLRAERRDDLDCRGAKCGS
jgi:hypothetical protein